MTNTLTILNEHELQALDHQYEFGLDVLVGFSEEPKRIASKYLYDAKGSEIFNQITRLPEYYLTRSEIEILTSYKKEISATMATDPFNLIELGPGEGLKTRILVEQFQADQLKFIYIPIDISSSAIKNLGNEFNQTLPTLEIQAIVADYFKGLKWLSSVSKKRNLVLFLGSTIGNLDLAHTKLFLFTLWDILHDGDYLLIGFDLRKDIDIMMRAYDDSDNLTRDFNLNLLSRINNELGANFNLNTFEHYPVYNALNGAMESYLLSKEMQSVYIKEIKQRFHFEPWEPIHIELSNKYSLKQIEQLAQMTGFSIVQTFIDSKNYFVDSLWQVHKHAE
jgi:dimethylhistidine N-methyltransferase